MEGNACDPTRKIAEGGRHPRGQKRSKKQAKSKDNGLASHTHIVSARPTISEVSPAPSQMK